MRNFNYLSIVAVISVISAISVHAQGPVWTDAWSISGPAREWPTGIGTDADRNLYVTTYSMNHEAANPRNAVTQFLTSWGPDRTQRWVRTIFSNAPTTQAKMAVDGKGNVYVAASFNGSSVRVDFGNTPGGLGAGEADNLAILKYNSQGRLVWHLMAIAEDSLTVNGIAISDDGVWIAGTYTGSALLGSTRITSAGASDVFIALLDTGTLDGAHGFFRGVASCGGTQTDQCHGVAPAPGGDAIILGQFSGTMNFGQGSLVANGPINFFLSRVQADGSIAWGIGDGGTEFRPASRFTRTPLILTTDRDGNSYIGISYLDGLAIAGTAFPAIHEADAIVLRYTAEGMPTWGCVMNGQILQLVQGLAVDSRGEVYVSGFNQLTSGTAFLNKLDSTGNPVWEIRDTPQRFGSTDGGPVCIDAAGNVYMTGNFSGQTRFGTNLLTSEGSSDTSTGWGDVYIARIGNNASGVGTADVVHAPFTLVQRDGMLILIPGPNSPDIVEAGLYSILGQRAAISVSEHPGNAASAIRLGLSGLARGSYLLHVRTLRGSHTVPVMIGR